MRYTPLMTTLHAHFDGRVFVPEEPVDLPTGQRLKLRFEPLEQNAPAVEGIRIERSPVTGLPVICVPPGTREITLEDVKRAEAEF